MGIHPVVLWVHRQLDKLPREPEYGPLIGEGRWYVVYPDGTWGMPLYYKRAKEFARRFNGKVLHCTQGPKPHEEGQE